MTYGITGNILSKSDVGTYTYGQVNGQCASGFAGPHAVTSISGTKNTTYCYDANGNMTTRDGRIITYTAFDKPTRITKGGNTVEFFYGPDRKRFKRVDNTVENGTVTTIYAAGKAYERIENAQGVTAKHYIGDFVVLTQTINTGAVAVNYLHRDHLGSVETITNEAGIVTQRMSFDAWGKRREVNWQPMGEEAIATFNTDTTTRGFTGHEQIDTVGLIHMNGRVYDAELGRFLSADPHIQALDNLQNFNRYSYVLNNPLSYTDPTGFFFSKLFKAIGKAFGKIFKAIGRAFKKLLRSPIFRAIIQIVACANPVTGIQCAIISGALAAAEGGSLSDVFKAVAFSFIAPKVWGAVKFALRGAHAIGKVLVHGVVNGAITVARGGNFLAGFASGALGKAVGLASSRFFGPAGKQEGLLGRTFMAAAAGCAGAVVSGGKCANGAITAAFAHLYNQEGLNKASQSKRSVFKERERIISLIVKIFKFDLTGIQDIKYDPLLQHEAETNLKGIIRVGPKTFGYSTGGIAVILGHEIEIHWHAQARGGRWFSGEQGEYMNEVEAYDYMLANQKRFGYSDKEYGNFANTRNIYYNKLNSANKARADVGDFSSYTK